MKRSDKRTTVSLAEVVWKMAEETMDAKGYNGNFSAYVAELIRRDKEKAEELDRLKKKSVEQPIGPADVSSASVSSSGDSALISRALAAAQAQVKKDEERKVGPPRF